VPGWISVGLVALLLVAPAAPAVGEVVRLVPDRASWRARNLFAWIRPGHFYGERAIEVETNPPGATLDLFYVRSNFQKLYEQTQAPARVVLPRRVEAGPRDAVNIRAFLPGFRQRQTSVRVDSSQDHVLLELEPLPNTLRALANSYFAGRGSLAFLTDEPATVRVQEREDGIQVVLAETALAPELGEALATQPSPLVGAVRARQLGEDLMVSVELGPEARGGAVDLRSRRSHDAIRDLHSYSLDFVPRDGGVAAVDRARAALAGLGPSAVSGCAQRFDETLRAGLDPADLSRALTPSGAFTDPYLRAAMKRLGELSPDGRVTLLDGTRYHTAAPLELAAAANQAAQVQGYLAFLRGFVGALEPDGVAAPLRSLVAPEMDPGRFAEVLARADAAEQSCRAHASR
jgi:hypothetical protein